MSHKKITLSIRGMHCRSCELLLDRELSAVPGVSKVRAYYKKGVAEVECASHTSHVALESAVAAAGYAVGEPDKKHWFSRDAREYIELAASATVALVTFALLQRFGLFENTSTGAVSSLGGVVLVGLTAGVSSCMALIGGLVLGISSRHAELHPEATPMQKFRPHLFFNLGRLLSYVLLGGLIGMLGSAISLSSGMLGIVTIVIGVVMLLLGIKLIGIFPRLEGASIALPSGIARLFGMHKEVKEYSHRGAFVTGALTFFVPCGFTQAMQLLAMSSGSFAGGASIMGAFALGTLPGIIGIGGLTSIARGNFGRYFFKVAGVVVIALAFLNIQSGYNLTGFTVSALVPKSTGTEQATSARMEHGKQIVEMTQLANGYSPSRFIVQKGIPVVWNINSTNPYSCAASISMPSAGILERLSPGENVITFTPEETGEVRFTCSMGMYGGSFTVID